MTAGAPRPLGPPLRRAFYARDTAEVARALLGHTLVSRPAVGPVTAGTIVETEAYVRGDSTSHARSGRTARNASMFAEPGTLYVYFTYGMHFCLNLSTEQSGVGVAVLVRALEITHGVETARARRGPRAKERDLARGPARLCVALGVARAHDAIDTCAPAAEVFVAEGEPVLEGRIARAPRVGVAGAPADIAAPLRFFVRDSGFVSR